MKELYHGSLEIVKSPEIRNSGRTLDYGDGFYLTSSVEQAENWVKRKFRDNIQQGFVNIFSYDEELAKNFRILNFKNPDENWLDFVMMNRLDREYKHHYDIVIGPVADDRVYASFAVYEAGLIDKEELIKELKSYRLVDQVLIHTAQALECIKWRNFREVRK